MNNTAFKSLLPQGLRDILPPDADHEADAVNRIMACFAAHGYVRVKPPLIEFESTLLDGAGSATAAHCFRVMDPLSQAMMGLRADMTPQVARIAVARLAAAARPLRLSYAGDVLRVKGSQLNPERQSCQAGLELIGSTALTADAEVLTLAVAALAQLGVPELSVDLTLPTLVPLVLAASGLSEDQQRQAGEALNNKDAATVSQVAGLAAPVLLALMEAAGPLDRAVSRLNDLNLPAAAIPVRQDLAAVVALVRKAVPGLALTLDPVEHRGFQYHSGLAFTLFSRRSTSELGRGGRYRTGGGEPATGATLFLDSILAVAAPAISGKRIFIPSHLGGDVATNLRSQGWVTLNGLDAVPDVVAEAKRLGCAYVLTAAGPEPVGKE